MKRPRGSNLRESYAALLQTAAASGYAAPWRLLALTPAEIILSLRAHQAQMRQRVQETWLLGRYVALAFHAPDRMPPCPAPLPEGNMEPEEMKRRLLAWRGKERAL